MLQVINIEVRRLLRQNKEQSITAIFREHVDVMICGGDTWAFRRRSFAPALILSATHTSTERIDVTPQRRGRAHLGWHLAPRHRDCISAARRTHLGDPASARGPRSHFYEVHFYDAVSLKITEPITLRPRGPVITHTYVTEFVIILIVISVPVSRLSRVNRPPDY